MDDQTLLDLFDSLKREFESAVGEFQERLTLEIRPVKDALERIETRLDRQGGIIQGGTRHVARLITWSEEMDQLLAKRDRRLDELEQRLSRLEQKIDPAA